MENVQSENVGQRVPPNPRVNCIKASGGDGWGSKEIRILFPVPMKLDNSILLRAVVTGDGEGVVDMQPAADNGIYITFENPVSKKVWISSLDNPFKSVDGALPACVQEIINPNV